MYQSTIIVADKTHAMFFSVERAKGNPVLESRLVEKGQLRNVALERLQASEKQDTRRADYPSAGPRNSPVAAGLHASKGGFASRSSMSDAENTEIRHALQLFSKEVVGRVEKTLREDKFDRLIVVAGPEMLGILRAEFNGRIPAGVELVEVRKDLAGRKAHEIHDLLARDDVLPPRRVTSPERTPRTEANPLHKSP